MNSLKNININTLCKKKNIIIHNILKIKIKK